MTEFEERYSEELKRLPDREAFRMIGPKSAPELTGTPKQIEFATKVRKTLAIILQDYVIHYDKNRYVEENRIKIARIGKEGMIKYIEYASSAIEESNKLNTVREKVNDFIELAKRIEKFNEIIQNDSAKFWLDHRDSSFTILEEFIDE